MQCIQYKQSLFLYTAFRMKEVLEEEPDEVDYLLRETHFNADELAKCLVATKKINRDLKASRENAKEEAKAMKRKVISTQDMLSIYVP